MKLKLVPLGTVLYAMTGSPRPRGAAENQTGQLRAGRGHKTKKPCV